MADPIDMDPPRYRKRGTVAIQLTSQLARQAATWLLESHTPRSPSLLGGFEDDELFARELGAIFKKAASRKRQRGSFERRLPREAARWLAWRFFRYAPRWASHGGAPEELLLISALCREAVGKRRGNPRLRRLTPDQVGQRITADADERWYRRLKRRAHLDDWLAEMEDGETLIGYAHRLRCQKTP